MNDGTDEHVVTAFLRNRGDVLLLRRGDRADGYRGRWDGVSGTVEGDPDGQVRRKVDELTGLADAVEPVRSGRPLRVEDRGRNRLVQPYLFDCDRRGVERSDEHDDHEWASPTAIHGRPTVPELWEAYERVAPTVRSIAADADHGAASLSIRALEVLRDRAGLALAEDRGTPDGDELADLARRLLEARPAMAVLRNRVNRAMTEATEEGEASGDTGAPEEGEASGDTGAPEEGEATRGRDRRPDARAVHAAARSGIARATDADEAAAERASERLTGRVLTLSRSGTVIEALRRGEPDRVFVSESRPLCEGVGVAEELADELPVVLHTDAAAAAVLAREGVERVVVGADAVLPDGRVVNKTGTRAVALAAAREGVPVDVVAASDKVAADGRVALESGGRSSVYDGDAAIDVHNPTFDVTPADAVGAIVTERGPLTTDDVGKIATELSALAGWRR